MHRPSLRPFDSITPSNLLPLGVTEQRSAGSRFRRSGGSRGNQRTISPFQYNAVPGDRAVTYLQGIKAGDQPGTFLLVGANDSPGPTPLGLAYLGRLDRSRNPAYNNSNGSGDWYEIAVPNRYGAAGTSVYGPDNLGGGLVNYVGAYTRDLGGKNPTPGNPSIVGFAYTGALDGSTQRGFRKVQGKVVDEDGQKVKGTYTFVHSVDGGLAVGNTDLADVDGKTGYFSLKSTAFLVSLATGKQKPIAFPSDDHNDRDLITHTAYGIWSNGKGRYTIAGGAGTVLKPGDGVQAGAGYLIDYDSVTGAFSNYTQFSYKNRKRTDLVTHFEGIYRDDKGRYWMPAASVSPNDDDALSQASVVMVKRRKSGGFREEARWQTLDVREDGTGTESVLSTGNSLYGNAVVGFANYPKPKGGVRQADYVIKGDWLDPGLVI